MSKMQHKPDINNSRTVKRGIRSVKENVRCDGDDLADPKSNKLTERVLELNQISRLVERPSEQADDSEVFYTLTQKGAEMAKRVAAGKGRSANDFIRHLKAAYVEGLDAQQDGEIDPLAFNWKRLSMRVSKYFKYAPGVSCLLGPLDAEIKVKKQSQRIQRKPVGKAVAPTVLEVEDFEAQEKRETERNMEVMWQALRKCPEGVGFLELVMNMESFAQLCENCFTLSFLVHNKRARMAKSDNNNQHGLRVYPYNEKAARQDGTAKALDVDRAQFILGYTTADWEDWKRYVRPEDCLMPHRAVHAEDQEVQNTAPSEAHEEEANGNSHAAEEEEIVVKAERVARSRKRSSAASALAAAESEEQNSEDGSDDDDDEEQLQSRRGKSNQKGGKRRKS